MADTDSPKNDVQFIMVGALWKSGDSFTFKPSYSELPKHVFLHIYRNKNKLQSKHPDFYMTCGIRGKENFLPDGQRFVLILSKVYDQTGEKDETK